MFCLISIFLVTFFLLYILYIYLKNIPNTRSKSCSSSNFFSIYLIYFYYFLILVSFSSLVKFKLLLFIAHIYFLAKLIKLNSYTIFIGAIIFTILFIVFFFSLDFLQKNHIFQCNYIGIIYIILLNL